MIHSSAVIDAGAKIGANVSIGAFSIIGAGVEIGDDLEQVGDNDPEGDRLSVDLRHETIVCRHQMLEAVGHRLEFGPRDRHGG